MPCISAEKHDECGARLQDNQAQSEVASNLSDLARQRSQPPQNKAISL